MYNRDMNKLSTQKRTQIISALVAIHPVNQCFFQEGGEFGLRRGSSFHALQFRQDSPDLEGNASNGSKGFKSCVGY